MTTTYFVHIVCDNNMQPISGTGNDRTVYISDLGQSCSDTFHFCAACIVANKSHSGKCFNVLSSTCAVFTTRCRKANYCRLERAASTPTACDRTISAGLPPDIDKSLERRTVRHRRHGVPQHQMCKSIDARSPTDG